MENKYDVIIVGAGNAGLSAAATAAQGGLKTLVLEKNAVPGGCATSFRRGRFEFEASLHEIANIGPEDAPGSIRRLLESYGVNVHWVAEKNLFRVIAGGEDGYDIRLRAGTENFVEDMEKAVPGSRKSMEAVFACIKKTEAAMGYLKQGKPDFAVLQAEHADFLRMASHSVDECLAALGVPKKAADLLKTYWPYLGAPTNELDFVHYGILLSRYVCGYPAVAAKTSHELSMAMTQAVRAAGGTVLFNTEVAQVLFDADKVCGVRAGGRDYYADTVVLNMSPNTAYAVLIPAEKIPPRAVQVSNAKKNGMLFFTVYLGLNRSAEELGIEDYSVFLYDSPDAMAQYEGCGSVDNSFIIANCINTVVPEASPEGTCTLFLTTMFVKEAWEEAAAKEDYKVLKNRIAQRMIHTLEEKTGTEIQTHIEEIAVATPSTFARYLGTPNGTPYGYQMSDWDTIITRAMNKSKEQFIPGLVFVGAYAENSDGYSSTLSNGHSWGMKIIKGAKTNEHK